MMAIAVTKKNREARTAAPAITLSERDRRRRKVLDAQRRHTSNEESRVVDSWLCSFDASHDGTLHRCEMRSLLQHLRREATGDAAAEVPEKLLDLIMRKYDVNGDGRIGRTEVRGAVERFGALLTHFSKLDEQMHQLFDRHDTDCTGSLPPSQLLTLLTELSRDRAYTPSAADVAFVLALCDKDHSGTITFDELGPVIATWKEAAAKVPPAMEVTVVERRAGGCACTLQ
jgi:Ca2+-binding EF-hand superfamily protein